MSAMFFVVPVGAIIGAAVFLPRLEDGAVKVLVLLGVIAVTASASKVGFSLLGEALGGASPDDTLYRVGKKLVRPIFWPKFLKGKWILPHSMEDGVRCLAGAMTFPWRRRPVPRAENICGTYFFQRGQYTYPVAEASSLFERKEFIPISGDLGRVFEDLLFVEMWLERTLNSGSSVSGVDPKAFGSEMVVLASDAGELPTFAKVVRSMADDDDDASAAILNKLAALCEKNARQTAAILRESPS